MNIRFLAALAAILFSVLHSQANWDDRFWPANEKPVRKSVGSNIVFQKEVVSTNLAMAIEERYWAVNREDTSIEEDVVGSLPRDSVPALVEMKQITGQLINKFLDQSRFPTPNDPTSIVVNTPTSSVIQLIYWNQSNILAHCNLPTNFFVYTPVRNLAGHQGFNTASNDVKYGWDALRKVLTNLMYTYENRGVLINETIKDSYSGIVDDPNGGRPGRGCFDDSESDGPYTIPELTISKYAGIVESEESATPTQYAIYDNAGQIIDEVYITTYYGFGSRGFVAALLGPSTMPILNNNHTAYTFFKENGEGPEDCGFTPFPPPFPRPVPPRVVPWVSGGTISTKSTTSDGYVFLTGARQGLSISCDVFNYLDNWFPNDAIPDCNIPECIEDRFPPGQETTQCGFDFFGGSGYRSDKEFVHVIKWDFTYK